MSGHNCSPLLSIVTQCCARNNSRTCSWRSFSSAFAASSSRWTILASRGVLQAEGPEALDFLQGIVSNDVRPLAGGGAQQPPIYATILTPKGKFLHDVFIHCHPEVPGAVLIDVDSNGKDAALQLLNRYKLRRPIKFQDVSSAYCVAAAWGSSAPPAGPWWRPDPRLGELGFRGLLPAAVAADVQRPGDPLTASSEDEYRWLRYRLGVAEGEAEIPAGHAAPLDYNVDVLHGVSYTKGCYVGQERNSFTHYRGVIRKRLMPVRLEPMTPDGRALAAAGPGPSSAGLLATRTDVLDAASGRGVGQLCGAVGPLSSGGAAAPPEVTGAGVAWGIAYLKLEAALPASEGKLQLVLAASEGGGVSGRGYEEAADAGRAGMKWRVVPVRPAWWPSEWGHEEELVHKTA